MLNKRNLCNIDYKIISIPLIFVVFTAFSLVLFPSISKDIIHFLWDFLANKLSFVYILSMFLFFCVAMFLCFSRFANIKLVGSSGKYYSTLSWGGMIFTSVMAADLLYWSLIEWVYYYNSNPYGKDLLTQSDKLYQASVFTLSHWGILPWCFYLLLAVIVGYFIHNKGIKNQRLSSCIIKPKNKLSFLIDGIAIAGLLAGVATTFSISIPLLSIIVANFLEIENSSVLKIILIILVAIIYTLAVIKDIVGIDKLSKISIAIFIILLVLFFMQGNVSFTIKNSVSSIGFLLNDFFKLSLFMDPMDIGDGFMSKWTVFYWAYWISWSVATPFFIAKISYGRSIKNIIFGGLFFGLLGTFVSFMIMSNYGMYLQVSGALDVSKLLLENSADNVILSILDTLKFPIITKILLAFCMILFYASTLDGIIYIICVFSSKNNTPSTALKLFWSFIFALLPCALIVANTNLIELFSVSIIVSIFIIFIIFLMIISFIKSILFAD